MSLPSAIQALGHVLQVSRAGDLADWLVRKSLMHPRLRNDNIMYDMNMGGYPDPTTRYSEVKFEHLTIQLQRAAYQRAHRLVRFATASFGLPSCHMSYLHLS